MKHGKKPKINYIQLIFIIILIASICGVVYYLCITNKEKQKYKNLQENIATENSANEKLDRIAKVEELQNENSDIIAWLEIEGTNINYPILHTTNNDFYLDHSFDKKYNEAGWVFLDYRNDKNLSNKNNILYAHSRLDKTMFGSLSKTLKSNWYNNKDNHIIRLSTETENTMWQIFSVYKIPEETYYITTNFNSDNDYQKFLNTIKERSIHNFSTNLTTEDKILTLSTCYSDTERTVVHAKLIKRSPK